MILFESGQEIESAPMIDVFTAVDLEHVRELRHSYRTYEKFWKGFKDYRWVILYDEYTGDEAFWRNELEFVERDYELHPTESGDWPQREKMLSSFVRTAPKLAKQKYFIKVDTDAFLTREFAINPKWLEGDPVYVSSPWSYSKPANVLETLDDWADKTELCIYPRLDIPYDPTWSRVIYPRIISYFYLGRTDWHQWLATLVGVKLPFPSQDTLAFYVAERTKAFYRKVRMNGLGWAHCRGKKLENAVRGVLGE